MKTGLIPIILALTLAGAAYGQWSPIPLTPGSFNASVIVARTAPPPIPAYCTVTIDGGLDCTGNTWYESGYCRLTNSGLPVAGSTFTALNASDHQFQMPPTYATNCALFLNSTVTNGTLTLDTPTICSSLSFLGSGGGGGIVVNYTVNHADGSSETGETNVLDWFNGASPAWIANGRFNVDGSQFADLVSGDPCLFNYDVTGIGTGSPVTSINLSYASGYDSAIFALSGSTGAGFTPLAVSGFNQDPVIEASAVLPGYLQRFTSVSMDDGPNNTGNAWYEIGWYTPDPATGLPHPGTDITNTAGDHIFRMPASYAVDNCVFIGNYNGYNINYTTGTLALATAAAYQTLSILNAAGSGPCVISYIINYADGTSDPTNQFSSPDWFSGSGAAGWIWTANGRITVGSSYNDSANSGNPSLFYNDITPLNTTVPIASIDFQYVSGGRAELFALSGLASGSFVSMPIPFTGYNADGVVEAGIPLVPSGLYTATTVSMDGGTTNTGNTWYEQGYLPNFPNSGLPHPGTTNASLSLPDHFYAMPASYKANDVIYVDASHRNANLTPITPSFYSGLSFLSSDANGMVTNQCVVQYSDGSSETNQFVSQDWFNNSPYAFTSQGRVLLDNRTINSDPGQNPVPPNAPYPRLFEAEFGLNPPGLATVTNLAVQFLGAANPTAGRMVILAVSGTSVLVPVIIPPDLPAQLLAYDGDIVTLGPLAIGGIPPLTYQWQANGVNLADGGRVTGSKTNALTIWDAQPGDSGAYQLLINNAQGSGHSAVCQLTVAPVGLNTNGFGWTLNGGAVIATNVLTLTDGNGSEARSAFLNTPVIIENFTAAFTYTDVLGPGGADGTTFILQNDPRGVAALGGAGGSLGVSGISPSVEFEMNIYQGNGVGVAFEENGTVAASGAFVDASPVAIDSGDPIRVTFNYVGGKVQVTLNDLTTGDTFSGGLAAPIPTFLGGNTAYVGFTGGDGGVSSVQEVTDFTFIGYPSTVALSASVAGATVTLSWPAESVVGNLVLQSTSSLTSGTWQNVTAPITVVNGKYQVIATSGQFFRLALQ
jgi:hypothetical protein